MMRLFFAVGLMLAINTAFAQDHFNDYDWDDEAKSYAMPDSLGELSEVVFKKKVIREINYNENTDELKEFIIFHKITGVFTDEAVEENNKIYLSSANSSNVLLQKARVVLPSGEVIDFDETDISTGKDEETDMETSYFAVNGLELGSTIEYMYKKELNMNDFGAVVFYQTEQPTYEYEYILAYPSFLRFASVFYGDSIVPRERELSDEMHALQWERKFVPAFKEEKVAFIDANVDKFMYKLDKNVFNGRSNITNYTNVAQSVYDGYLKTPEKKEYKCLKKMYKEIGVESGAEDIEKIRTIENYMKTNFVFLNFGMVDTPDPICTCLESKFGLTDANLRITAALLYEAGVDFEFVYTTSRDIYPFDENFETYDMLQNVLFYFPSVKQYMAPTERFLRLNGVPAEWTENHGLFVNKMTIGGVTSGVSEVKYIKGNKMEDNFDKMDIVVDFDLEEGSADVEYKKVLSGVYAQNYQPYFFTASEERKEELEELMINWISDDLDILISKLKNIESEDIGVKPLEHEFKIRSTDFLEESGERVLFKIGALIGPQSELYEEKDRTQPVDASYNHGYFRTISFEIPEGYQVKNLDDLNIDFTYDRDGKQILAFVSKYKIEGSTVLVEIDEFYKENHFSVEEYEAYRSTINGAADFNKVTLVMVQK